MGKKKEQSASRSPSPSSPKKGKGKKAAGKGTKAWTGDGARCVAHAPLALQKEKDPNAPKRALSAYLFYASERRPELKVCARACDWKWHGTLMAAPSAEGGAQHALW